ncbi:MAG: PKD domain-containing protein [Bacteroidota bacterium]
MRIKNYLIKLIVAFTFFIFNVKCALAQGDPYADAGADTSVTCSNPCVELIGSYFYAGQTNSYLPIPIPYTPFPYNAGAPILVNIDDAWSNAINLPFNFCFFGINYNKVVIGSNGIISFNNSYAGGGAGSCPWSLIGQSPLPNAGLPLNSIMGVYEDIDPTNQGDIFWQVIGSFPSRKLVVSFYEIPYYGDPNSVSTGSCANPLYLTSQIVLYETTNAIDIYIKDKPVCTGWNNGLAIEGIQNSTGTVAYTIAGRNNTVWTTTNDAYRFLPMGPSIVSFSWLQNGNVVSNSSLYTVCPLQNTQYVAQVVYNGCNGAIVTLYDTVNVSVAVPFQASIQSIQPSGCTPQNNGSASTSIISGTGPFTYLWNTGATTSSITNIGPGTYTCTITDPSGCSKQDTVVLQYPSFLNANPATIQNLNCAGSANGSVSINAIGGTAPYTYSWSNGATGIINSNLIAGSYTVTITDQNGCTFVQTNTITQPSALNIIPNLINNNCYGGSTGNITLNVSGASPPYTYVWSPNVSSTNIGNGLINGNYTITVSDNNGCTAIANATITSPTALNINATITNSTCQLPNASIIVNPSGATPGYNYNWSNSVSSASNLNILSGIYTVTVADNLGCTKDTVINISSTSVPQVTISGSDSICAGNNVVLTANVVSGIAPFNYNWNPTSINNSVATFTPTQSQNFQVIVSDVNGCVDTTDFDVAVIALPVVNGTVTDAKCFGSNDGSVSLNIIGGITPFTYSWVPNVSSGSNAQNLIQGNYQVNITDNLGCTASNSFVVNQPDSLQLNLIVQGSTCNLPNGSVQAIVGGGVQSYSYLWSTSSTDDNIINLLPGSYSLTVTDANGCVKSNSITINAVPIPVVSISGVDSICVGDNCNMNASVANQILPITYQWSNGLPSLPSVNVAPTLTQNYTLVVIDGNGCSDTTDFTVNVQNLPVITFNQTDTAACGELDYTFNASIVPSNVTYAWDFGDGNSSNDVSPTNNYSNAGVYTPSLIVTSTLGCESSLMLPDLITVHPIPQIDFNVTPSILFDDYSQAEFTNLSVGAVNYIWNFGDGSDTSHAENPIHFYPDSGTYVITLIGESDKGCIDSISNTLLHVINSYAFVPSCFTPNNDGKNDVLKLFTVNVSDFYFQLLDRWGRVLFETNNPESTWDGTYQGNYVQEGVFVYKMEYKSLQRKHMETFGRVTLLR